MFRPQTRGPPPTFDTTKGVLIHIIPGADPLAPLDTNAGACEQLASTYLLDECKEDVERSDDSCLVGLVGARVEDIFGETRGSVQVIGFVTQAGISFVNFHNQHLPSASSHIPCNYATLQFTCTILGRYASHCSDLPL